MANANKYPTLSVVLIINYFGRWPFWFEFFLESCRRNTNFNWVIYTDCEIPNNSPDNVEFFPISFKDYCQLVSDKLDISFKPDKPYKLCDIKPALGLIHSDIIEGYDFWGYTDIDIIYGNLSTFFTREKMLKYDIISSGSRRIWGFLCLLRNSEYGRNVFKNVDEWKDIFESEKHYAFDEKKFSNIFVKHKNFPLWLRKVCNNFYKDTRKVCFDDAWSNPGWKHGWIDGAKNFPNEWYWDKGILTNDIDNREFSYLHFIEWKLNEWKELDTSQMKPNEPMSERWIINENGINIV